MIDKILTLFRNDTVKQLLKYGMVGGLGFAIEFTIFWLLVTFWSVQYPFSPFCAHVIGGTLSVSTIDTNISHIISSIIAITNNFILNSYFTFKVTDKKLKRFLSFFGIASVGLIVSTTLLSFFIEVLEFNNLLAKFTAVAIVASMQFAFNKFFTFKSK